MRRTGDDDVMMTLCSQTTTRASCVCEDDPHAENAGKRALGPLSQTADFPLFWPLTLRAAVEFKYPTPW